MRVLVLGGTGAMGVHLIRLVAEAGNEVVVTSRRSRSPEGGISYVLGDAKDPSFLKDLLSCRWGAIVDFMVWSTDEFRKRRDMFLDSTDQYVFLSSYRVYADSLVITEQSPRLLDVCDDVEYLATDEYALAKARCEDLLMESGRDNWTIVRPAITYDGSGRFQLGVHEANMWLWRALHGIAIPLPQEMLCRQATMTWGGDVARLISKLIGNPAALGETFTTSTSEHLTWGEISGIYKSVVSGLKVLPCSLTDFESARGGVYQIRYDRMFDRVIDNSKVLAATGVEQGELRVIGEGLSSELSRFLETGVLFPAGPGANARMDRIVGGAPSLRSIAHEMGVLSAVKYSVRRLLT